MILKFLIFSTLWGTVLLLILGAIPSACYKHAWSKVRYGFLWYYNLYFINIRSREMRTFATLFLCCIVFVAASSAQGQTAQRYVLLEHFTQASCGPCASYNPEFEKNIVHANPDKVHHIAYHTSWPGKDPMYSVNTTENDTRTQYYNITGVPDVVMLGDKNSVPNAFGVWQNDINTLVANGSPLAVVIEETEAEGKRTVVVTVTNVSAMELPASTLRTAIVESEVRYDTPPGSNGEKVFPNVFRKMLPHTTGDAIPALAAGESKEFTYTYNLNTAWKAEEVYAIAFVQNDATKIVLNSASTRDAKGAISVQNNVQNLQPKTTGSFALTAKNAKKSEHKFTLQLKATAPDGWTAAILVGDSPYTEGTEFSLDGSQERTVELKVTPSDAGGIGTYTVELQSASDKHANMSLQSMYVISNVSNLLISNETKWEQEYVTGLGNAAAKNHAATAADVFTAAAQGNALTGVRNIYYNVGWTFPSLTDERADALQQFIEQGGNLFIAGQDIGWDQSGAQNAYGTDKTKAFYRDYMQAQFLDDGSGVNSALSANANDEVFGTTPLTALTDAYAGNFYPDVISPLGSARPIFYYNQDKAKVAGVRTTIGRAKIVYLGIGIESVVNDESKNAIVKAAHDWFEGLITTEVFDAAMQKALAYPNPATESLEIPLPTTPHELVVRVVDMAGTVVWKNTVQAGTTSLRLPVHSFATGTYMYSVYNGTSMVKTEKFTVLR